MDSFSKARRQARLAVVPPENEIISDRAYNAVMGGVVLFGLAVNYVLCARVGNVYQYINPLAFFFLYLACAIAGCVLSARSENPFVSFLGYCLVVVPVGLVISTAVQVYGGLDSAVVRQAFLYTLIITATMLCFAMIRPDFFARMGGVLLSALTGVVLVMAIGMIFGFSGGFISYISAIIFSLYIGYDFYRSQTFARTRDNAVDCALDIYLDIANLFLILLRIFGNREGSSSSRR